MLVAQRDFRGIAGHPVKARRGAGLQLALRDRTFMIFTALSGGMWFMWVQFSVALPLQATAVTGTADAVSWTYMINAALSITLQYPLVRGLSRWLSPVPMLAAGMVLMACGFGAIAFVQTTPLLLAAVTGSTDA